MATLKEIQDAINNKTFDPSKLSRKQRNIIDEAIDRGCDIIFDDLEIGWELSLSFPKRVNQYKNLKLRENKLIKKIDFESYKDFYLWLQKN